MRVVLDTNILVSALIAAAGNPAVIYRYWEAVGFTLISCAEQLLELRSTLQTPRVALLIHPQQAGRLVNQIRRLAEDVSPLPHVERSPDHNDDFLLASSEAGKADYLETKSTRIVSAKKFSAMFE